MKDIKRFGIESESDFSKVVKEAYTMGFKVIPMHEGKNPRGNHQAKKRKAILTEIETGLNRDQLLPCNVGIQTGEASGILVIDIDKKHNGIQNFNTILEQNNISNIKDLNTPTVKTGGEGYHLYFKYNTEKHKKLTQNNDISGFSGIDLKCNSGLIVYPGSIYPGCKTGKHECYDSETEVMPPDNKCRFKGNYYTWLEGRSIKDIPLAEVPEWLDTIFLAPLREPKKRGRPKKEDAFQRDKDIIMRTSEFINIKPSNLVQMPNTTEMHYGEVNSKAMERCLEVIPISYWDHYDSWVKLMLCMKSMNISKELAQKYSKKSSKYTEEGFEKLWDTEPKHEWNIGFLYNLIYESRGKDFYDRFSVENIPLTSRDEIELFSDTDRGIASICWRYLKDENLIKVIELENGKIGNIYIWDDDIKLWKKKELLGLGSYILKTFFLAFLTNLLAKERKRIENNSNLLIPKKAKMIADKRRYVNTVAGSISIAKYCIDFFIVHHSFELKFNTSPFELPLPNKKIINLKTKEVRERVSTDFWTKEAQFNYTPLNSYPKAEKYILSLMNDKKEKADFLSLFLGYCLSGSTAEKIMLICVGDGDNGKTALMSEIMNSILGSFFSPVADEVIVNGARIGGANPGLVQLKDRRLACISEINSGSALNEKSIKAILGGDNVSARDMYQSSEVIKLQAKLVMLTNVKPTFNYSDKAMKEKLVLLIFEQHFEKDERYIQSLKEEHRDEIGSYLVEKAFEYFQMKERGERLKPCLEMEEDKLEFIEEIDTVKSFLDENYCIVVPSQKAYVFQAELYAEYKDYCFNMRIDNYLTYLQFKDYMLNVKGISYFKTKRINKGENPLSKSGFNCLQKLSDLEEESQNYRYLKNCTKEEKRAKDKDNNSLVKEQVQQDSSTLVNRVDQAESSTTASSSSASTVTVEAVKCSYNTLSPFVSSLKEFIEQHCEKDESSKANTKLFFLAFKSFLAEPERQIEYKLPKAIPDIFKDIDLEENYKGEFILGFKLKAELPILQYKTKLEDFLKAKKVKISKKQLNLEQELKEIQKNFYSYAKLEEGELSMFELKVLLATLLSK